MKFKDKLKKIYQSNYFELTTIFIITLLMTLKFSVLMGDEIWIYGFSYNIAKGLIPYRDFNMVVTPLYPLLQGLFMYIFDNNIVIFHIFNAFICTGIFYLLKKLYFKVYYIIYFLLLGLSFEYSNLLPGYNVFILFLLLLILLFEESNNKYKDFMIGIFLGLVFITKQNMGIFLFLPTLTLFNLKKISKRVLGFIIPVISLIIYLFSTNSFLEFINYTILGLFDFKDNFIFDSAIIFLVISLIYCLYQIFFKKNNDITLKYFLFFLLMGYPLFDLSHLLFPFSIILAYFLNQFKHQREVYKVFFYLTYLIIIIVNLVSTRFITLNDSSLKGRVVRNDTYKYIEDVSNKLNDYFQDDSIDKIYFFADYAYLFKLYNDIEINKFDLINRGNMGYKGASCYIDEFSKNCLDKKCIFIIDLYRDTQIDTDILDYIENNYIYLEEFQNFSVYKN